MRGFPVKAALNDTGQVFSAEQRGTARRFGHPEFPRHRPEITDDSECRYSRLVSSTERAYG